MEAPITMSKGLSYVLNVPNLEATLKDFEREEIAIVAVIGPARSGKYMIASAIKSYLDQNFGANSRLANEDVFCLQQRDASKTGITVINRKISTFHGKVILMISQIPRDMDKENARRLLFYATALSSFQIFNIPDMITDWDRELIRYAALSVYYGGILLSALFDCLSVRASMGVLSNSSSSPAILSCWSASSSLILVANLRQNAKEWNTALDSKETKQVIILRDVLLPSYDKRTEMFGRDRIDCFPLPSPGGGIFGEVPSANTEFRKALTKFMQDSFGSRNLASKKIEGRTVDCAELLLYSKELDPGAPGQSAKRVRVVVKAIRQYKEKMSEIEPSALVHLVQLKSHHNAARQVALNTASGGETARVRNAIDNEYVRYEEAGRKIQTILKDLGIQSEARGAGSQFNIAAETIHTVTIIPP